VRLARIYFTNLRTVKQSYRYLLSQTSFALWIAQEVIVIMYGKIRVVSTPGFIPAQFNLVLLFRQSDNLKRNDQRFL